MEFFRPEYGSGWPFPSPGDLPNPEINPRSPTLQVDSLPAEPQWKPKSIGVGSLSFLQGIFPTQESNQGLLHCRWILYQLSYEGSPMQESWSRFLCFPPGDLHSLGIEPTSLVSPALAGRFFTAKLSGNPELTGVGQEPFPCDLRAETILLAPRGHAPIPVTWPSRVSRSCGHSGAPCSSSPTGTCLYNSNPCLTSRPSFKLLI